MTLLSRLRALARSRTAPRFLQFSANDKSRCTRYDATVDDSADETMKAAPNLGGKIYPDYNAMLAEVESGDVVEDEPSSQMWMSSGDQSNEDRFQVFRSKNRVRVSQALRSTVPRRESRNWWHGEWTRGRAERSKGLATAHHELLRDLSEGGRRSAEKGGALYRTCVYLGGTRRRVARTAY